MAPQPQPIIQQQHYAPSSHMSNGRNEPEEISSHHRDQPQYDAYDQYSRGRVPSAGPERTYHNQYDMQRDRQSPIVSFNFLSFTRLSLKIFLCYLGKVRGLFLESPSNFTGPKSNIQMAI